MGVITTYKCDRCGKEWNPASHDEQPVAVAIHISFGEVKVNQFSSHTAQAMWCRTCVMKAGVHPPITPSDKAVAPETPPSFEEKFIELLNSMGFVQAE